MNVSKREELIPIFKDGAPVRGVNKIEIGKGLFEADLVNLGYEKRELKRLVRDGILLKVTTRWQNAWRNTYVLPETL